MKEFGETVKKMSPIQKLDQATDQLIKSVQSLESMNRNEHRIMGKATLPGTAYLEMVRAAFEHHTGTQTMEIRNAYFLMPLAVGENEEKEVRTILKIPDTSTEISIFAKVISSSGVSRTYFKTVTMSATVETTTTYM